MASDINDTHRAGTIKSALHIAENSTANSIDKINAICLALYPDDLKALEATMITTLRQLIAKA